MKLLSVRGPADWTLGGEILCDPKIRTWQISSSPIKAFDLFSRKGFFQPLYDLPCVLICSVALPMALRLCQ